MFSSIPRPSSSVWEQLRTLDNADIGMSTTYSDIAGTYKPLGSLSLRDNVDWGDSESIVKSRVSQLTTDGNRLVLWTGARRRMPSSVVSPRSYREDPTGIPTEVAWHHAKSFSQGSIIHDPGVSSWKRRFPLLSDCQSEPVFENVAHLTSFLEEPKCCH